MKKDRYKLTDSLGLHIASYARLTGRLLVVAMSGVLIATSVAPGNTAAYFTTCIANISPDSMSVGMSSTFAVSVTNGLSGPIRWIDVSVPSGNYTYAGNSIGNGWTTSDYENGTTIHGSSMDVGQTQEFPVVVVSGSQASSSEAWQVQVSQNDDGSSPVDCTGSLQTSVTGSLPQDTVNGVSSVAVQDISTTVATVTWQTTNPSSTIVYYGTDTDYDQHSDFDDTLTTDHSVQLTGLSPATTYHFQVVGADINGNYAHSIDSTFLTMSAQQSSNNQNQQTPVVQQQITKSVATSSTVIRPTFKPDPNDATPPIITSITELKGAYVTAPEVTVSARDNAALAYAEYSTDGGHNWLPAVPRSGVGTSEAVFTFTPAVSQDGNYPIVVRVFDAGGAVATSFVQTLVIDKLPPTVAGDVLNVGPDVLQANSNGSLTVAASQDIHIALSAVGGPTSISVEAVQTDNTNVRQSFSLSKDTESGLWSGVLSFLHPGSYHITAYAMDGAQNKTQKVLQDVTVLTPQKVTDSKTNHPVKTEVTVYTLNPDTNRWVIWDGSSYGRQNPIKTGDTGGYTLYLPNGEYYISYAASGYGTVVTRKFGVEQAAFVSLPIQMRKQRAVSIGQLRIVFPGVATRVVDFDYATYANQAVFSHHVTEMPTDAMKLLDGTDIKPTDLYGKPTVISFVSTWAPSAQDQMAILNKLDMSGVNVFIVASGEAAARVQAYLQIAGYDIRAIHDPDNALIARYGAIALPTTYFIDRHGTIQQSAIGVLSEKQIANGIAESL